ncbi:ATP-binding cassette domain-containing protein [Nesterenkonia haasae]|uniref:ATP-binding cassette domain-containing protein n=1 Tax=Nesterenkonia haasae TaxID=2587813 RepID=UPI001390B1D6|nr:ABC transporter ATP-binding protein [Nesterenkonia haasae]
MLRLDSLQGRAGTFELGPITLECPGPITALIGPNGSGKTTFLKALLGESRADGEVHIDGMPIEDQELETFRHVSYVADAFPEVFSTMKTEDYLYFLASARHDAFGADIGDQLADAYDMLNRLGVDIQGKRISGLSFGNQRKVHLASGLMHKPRLFIVDEPQTGMDFSSSYTFQSIITQMATERGVQVFMSNHDLDSVARCADSIIALKSGKISAEFPTSDIREEDLREKLASVFISDDE